MRGIQIREILILFGIHKLHAIVRSAAEENFLEASPQIVRSMFGTLSLEALNHQGLSTKIGVKSGNPCKEDFATLNPTTPDPNCFGLHRDGPTLFTTPPASV